MLTTTNNISCSSCAFAKVERLSDLTLGDQWQLASQLPERNVLGASVVIVNSEKGMKFLNDFSCGMYLRIEDNKTLNAPPLFLPTKSAVSFSRFLFFIKRLPVNMAVNFLSLNWKKCCFVFPFYLVYRNKRELIRLNANKFITKTKMVLGWV